MSADLLQPPGHVAPAESLAISQQAPQFFKSQAPSLLPYPLSILTSSESPEQWHTYENLLVACLRTGDDESAFVCVKELTERFGESNERVQFLNGLYQEATAEDDKALEKVLAIYDQILTDTPTNFPIRKRRAALLKSMGRTADAIEALTELLDSSPIDAEAWAELSDLYLSQASYSQAVFCLEEVLLVTPNAWNVSHPEYLDPSSLADPSASDSRTTRRSHLPSGSIHRRYWRSAQVLFERHAPFLPEHRIV